MHFGFNAGPDVHSGEPNLHLVKNCLCRWQDYPMEPILVDGRRWLEWLQPERKLTTF